MEEQSYSMRLLRLTDILIHSSINWAGYLQSTKATACAINSIIQGGISIVMPKLITETIQVSSSYFLCSASQATLSLLIFGTVALPALI